jgi:hypothetical protein
MKIMLELTFLLFVVKKSLHSHKMSHNLNVDQHVFKKGFEFAVFYEGFSLDDRRKKMIKKRNGKITQMSVDP